MRFQTNRKTLHSQARLSSIPYRRLRAFAASVALTSLLAVTPLPAQETAPRLGSLVRMTPSSSGLLDRLPQQPADGPALLAAVEASSTGGTSLTRDVAAALAGVSGVYADLSLMDPAAIAHNPMFEGALAAGIPLLLEGDPTGDRLKTIAGLGVDIDPLGAALVRRVGENRYVLVKLGARGSLRGEVSSGTLPRAAGFENRTDAVFEAEPFADLVTVPDPERVALLADTLLTSPWFLEGAVMQAVAEADTQPECPAGSCKQWVYVSAGLRGSNQISHEWDANGQQSPFIDLTFLVTLHDSVNPDFKALTLYTTGEAGPTPAYFGTGGMYKNGDHHRGYFNEKMKIRTDLLSGDPDVKLGATSPGNTNNKSSVTTSNSFTVGVDSNGSSGSYTAGWSYSRDIEDFGISNVSNPFGGDNGVGRAAWTYDLTASNGGSYDGPGDLVDNWGSIDCDLFGLGSIAENNLQAATISTWNAEGDYNGSAQFKLYAYQKVRKVKSSLTWYAACEWEAKGKSISYSTSLIVDFGSVNQD